MLGSTWGVLICKIFDQMGKLIKKSFKIKKEINLN